MADDLEKTANHTHLHHEDGLLDPVLTSPKALQIRDACRDANIASLVALATSNGGLLHDQLRCQAWPIMLGCALPKSTIPTGQQGGSWRELPPHNEEGQIELDVDRSFVNYPKDSSKSIEELKSDLSILILTVLRTHPDLCYFQGYHDIASVFLLVLGLDLSPASLARLSMLRIRDFMLPTLSGTFSHLYLLPALLHITDPSLASLIPANPGYALAATLTLFSHVVPGYETIVRLFDFLLAAPASAPVYLFAAVIRSRREELVQLDPHDQDMLHFQLSKLPQLLECDALVTDAMFLLQAHPPHTLGRPWRAVSQASVLRTALSAEQVAAQSFEEGQAWLLKQSAEARRQTALEKRLLNLQRTWRRVRRPATYVGSALVVAVIAALVARNSDKGVPGAVVRNVMFGMWRTLGGR